MEELEKSSDLDLHEIVNQLENQIGLRSGFLYELKSEDDWSFVIKAHAFLEVAVSYLISEALARPELLDVLSRIDMGDARIGKLAFAGALDLFGKDEKRFIRKFSELRNSIVHNIQDVDFTFETHFSTLDKNQRNSFINSFGYFSINKETFKYDGTSHQVSEFVAKSPKLAVWFSIMNFAGVVYLNKDMHLMQKEIEELEQELQKHSNNG